MKSFYQTFNYPKQKFEKKFQQYISNDKLPIELFDIKTTPFHGKLNNGKFHLTIHSSLKTKTISDYFYITGSYSENNQTTILKGTIRFTNNFLFSILFIAILFILILSQSKNIIISSVLPIIFGVIVFFRAKSSKKVLERNLEDVFSYLKRN